MAGYKGEIALQHLYKAERADVLCAPHDISFVRRGDKPRIDPPYALDLLGDESGFK